VAFVNSVALYQALVIVLDNAVRYAVPGTIQLRLARPPGVIELTVADQGPGLAAAVRSEGARVGLDLCREMLRKAGGDLSVTRDAPDGTVFQILLPDHVTGSGAGPGTR
jgi:signal transduction histidine kinase